MTAVFTSHYISIICYYKCSRHSNHPNIGFSRNKFARIQIHHLRWSIWYCCISALVTTRASLLQTSTLTVMTSQYIWNWIITEPLGEMASEWNWIIAEPLGEMASEETESSQSHLVRWHQNEMNKCHFNVNIYAVCRLQAENNRQQHQQDQATRS